MPTPRKVLTESGLTKLTELIKEDTIHHVDGVSVDIDYSGGTITTTGLDDKAVDGAFTINGYNYIFRVNQLTADGNTVGQEIYMPFYPLTQQEEGTRGTFGWYRYGVRESSDLPFTWTLWYVIKLKPISNTDIDDIISDVFADE